MVDDAGTANRRYAVAADDWKSMAGRGRRNRAIPGGAGRRLREGGGDRIIKGNAEESLNLIPLDTPVAASDQAA